MPSLQFTLAAVAALAMSPLTVRCMIINIGFPPLNATFNGPITPIAINASRGDILVWTFDDAAKKANHSVVQVSFDDPCAPLADGFASPIGALNEADFAVMITDDSAAIYWTCGATSANHLHNHCQEGEVGFISPQAQIGPNESDQTIRTLGIKLPTAPYSPALTNVSASGLGSGAGAQVVDAQAAETSTAGSVTASTASGTIASSTPTQSQPSSAFSIRSASIDLITVGTGLIVRVAFHAPRRARAPSPRERPTLTRLASTSTSTPPQKSQFVVDLHAVASLQRPPSALYDIAVNALTRNKVAHSYIVEELGKNPTLDDTKRWDLIQALVDMNKDCPSLRAQKIALQPAYDAAIDSIAHLTQLEEREAAANEILAGVRTKEAPFLSAEHAILLHDTLRGDLHDASFVITRWILNLRAHLVRLGTKWERAVFDRQTVFEDAARQLGLVEDWLAYHFSETWCSMVTGGAFMYAYGATRVAPDEVARRWDEIVESGESLTLETVERALASVRTLDALNTVWAQIQTMSLPPSPPGVIPFPLMCYALHLARLDARDQAEEIAKRYPVHEALCWLVDPGAALESGQSNTVHMYARANRERANVLAENGLDLEDIIFMLSVHSPYRDALRGIRSGSGRHRGLAVKEQ